MSTRRVFGRKAEEKQTPKPQNLEAESGPPKRASRVTSSNPCASSKTSEISPTVPPKRLSKRTAARHHEPDFPLLGKSGTPLDEPHETFHWDPVLPGFGIRVSTSGNQVYFVQYRERGRTRRRIIAPVLTTDQRLARRRARHILSAVKVGLGVVDPFNPPIDPPALSFATFAEHFWEAHAHRWAPRTQISNRKLINRVILPAFGKIAVADITRPMVLKWHAGLGERPGTANRTLPVLSVMMVTAETMGLRPRHSNPCRNVTRFPSRRMERFLSRDEVAALGVALRRADQRYPQQCAIIRLLLLTGARKREIESLCWSYLDGSFAHLPEAKTGPRTIYLGRPARDLLATISRGDSDFVFPDARKDGHAEVDYNIWARIRVAAGLDDVRLHDLRHTFGSHAAMNGVSQPTIAMVLGHALFETTDRYTHLSDSSVRDAIGRVSGHLARATGFAGEGATR
jgi:integrase